MVDDILDFTQTAEQLGKPQGQDLASGNLTAPVIYALQQNKELEEIIQSESAHSSVFWSGGGRPVVCVVEAETRTVRLCMREREKQEHNDV